jgi:hypothetical protein
MKKMNQNSQHQKHPTQGHYIYHVEQRDKLLKLLNKFPKLFSGKLGLYPHCKLHLDFVENVKPVHKRPFPVAHAHLDVFMETEARLMTPKVSALLLPRSQSPMIFYSDVQLIKMKLKPRLQPERNIVKQKTE